MAITLGVPSDTVMTQPRIAVVGVGGAGGNAVNNMIRDNLLGCEFLICNTDGQAMHNNACDRRIQLGPRTTGGLGAGSRPEVGKVSAEESIDEVMAQLEGCNMVFVTAGMGGGTGTGAAPVIAAACRERKILTVGVVTKPFSFEGAHRQRMAEAGINELSRNVDTLIIIPNQNLFRIANEKTTFADAFKMADDVLYSGVRSVTDLMVRPGLINLDFADIRSVMTEMGKAMMGTGEREGPNRAIEAAEEAVNNPLLDDVSLRGARGVLINITGGMDMTLMEVDQAANRIRDEVDPDANIIFGSTFDESMQGRIRISVVATGIDAQPGQLTKSAAVVNTVETVRPAPAPTSAPAAPQQQPAIAASTAASPAPAQPNPAVHPFTKRPVTHTASAVPNYLAGGNAAGVAMHHEAPAEQPAMVRQSHEQPQHAPEPNYQMPEPASFNAMRPAQAPERPQPPAYAEDGLLSIGSPAQPKAEPAPAKRSLFQKMIGIGGRKPAKAEPQMRQEAPQAYHQPQPAAPQPQAQRPTHFAPQPAPAASVHSYRPPAKADATGLYSPSIEDDNMAIPAFLRKQAN